MMLKSLLKNFIFQNIVFFLLPALIIVSVTMYVYISEREKALATFSTHEEILIKIGKRTIESSFDVIKDDLVYLSLARFTIIFRWTQGCCHVRLSGKFAIVDAISKVL